MKRPFSFPLFYVVSCRLQLLVYQTHNQTYTVICCRFPFGCDQQQFMEIKSYVPGWQYPTKDICYPLEFCAKFWDLSQARNYFSTEILYLSTGKLRKVYIFCTFMKCIQKQVSAYGDFKQYFEFIKRTKQKTN